MADLSNRKHIFFDLDDTLWDFRKNSGLVLARLFDKYGLAGRLNTTFGQFQVVYNKLNLELWSKYYRREIDKHYLRNNRFNLVFNQFGHEDYEGGLKITAEYLSEAPRGTHLKEGCLDTLAHLKQRHNLHIITNGFSDVQATKIDSCCLRPYFSHIIVSEEHGLVKPEEKIFRLAESLAGALPGECVMIGDSFESDIAGGINAGWEVIYFGNEAAHDYKGHRISKLPELKILFGM
jgi:putative hydrolase of the HAD superfamily